MTPPPPPADGLIFVCQTCPRPGERHTTAARPGAGAELAARLEVRLAERNSKVQLVRVDCLSRCQRPCNVRVSGRRKAGFEFHSLTPADAADLARFLDSYSASVAGDLDEAEMPPVLAARR
jgi:predicted metal-binding protein